MSKKALTAAILVLGLTLSATWFLAGRETERQAIAAHRAQISEISAIQANLQNNLEMQTALIHILRTIVAISPDLDQQQFENILDKLEPKPEGVLVLARNGIISSVYPNDLEENFIGLDLREMPRLAEAARQVMETHLPVLTGPFIFESGKRSLIYLSELSTKDGDKTRFWGVGLLLIDLDRLLANLSFDNWARGSIAVRLHKTSGVMSETLYGNGKLFVQPNAVVGELENPGIDWDVAVMPFPIPGGETMILMIWGTGIPVSIVFSILIYRILVELVERRKTQAALQQSEDRLADVLQATSDWMWETDQDFRFTNISGRMRAVTGLKATDVLGKTRLELAETPEERKLLAEHEGIMKARQPFRDFRYSLNTPAHGTTYLRTSGTPVYDNEERFVGYWGTTTDITAEIEAQNRATQAERLLHDAAESMVEGLSLFDAGGNLQVFNARFSALLKENGIEKDVSLYSLLMEIIDRNFTKGEEAFKEVSSPENIPPRLEFPIKSGHWIHLSSQKTHDGGMVSIWTDISERKKREEERTILEDELRQAQKLEAIGTLAGGIAHEINTPTQYIGDNLQFINDSFVDVFEVIDKARSLVRENEGSEPVHAALQPLEESLKKADIDYLMEEIPTALKQSLEGISQVARIVKAMKEFSHPVNAEHGPADLNRAIENTLAVCRNEWKHVAEVTLDLDPALPLVNCHLGEINQVFLNLIVNAAHAVESAQRGIGEIHIESRQDGEYVDVRISDTGIGIPQNIIYKIFDLFFTTKKVGKGSGQGLPIARDIVRRRHGGNILVESTAGVGTTFTVRLPIAGKAKETETDDMNPENTQSGEAESTP